MTFQDSETAAITLKELATGAPADQYVAVSPTDTTVGHLNSKLTVGSGLTKSITSPGGNEKLNIAPDTAILATQTDLTNGIASAQ